MVTLLTRLYVKRQLKTVIRCPIIQKYSTFYEAEHVKPSVLLLFKNCDRYNVFQKSTNSLYEFDNETRNIVTWQSPKFQQTCTWDQPTDSHSDDELIFAFDNLLKFSIANHIPLSDSRFNEFVDDFTQRLQDFSLNQTIRALQNFVRHPMERDLIQHPNCIELLQAFDQACTIKSQDLLPEQLLFISSIWINIPFAKKTYTVKLLCRLFNRYMKTFNAPQMTQALYFINFMREEIEDIRALENVLEKNISDLSIEEFSSILWTFVRFGTKIEKQELKLKFFAYLEAQDLSRLSDRSLATVLTNISKISTTAKSDSARWQNIAKSLQSTLHNRSLKTCILMANVGITARMFDNDIIANVFHRCLNHADEFSELSMPDLEYLSRVLSTYNQSEKDELQKIGHLVLNEIENRLDQVASRGFYAHFANIVRNLTVINVYNLELMDNILRPDYIRFIHKKSKQLDLPLYEIDGYNRINLKNIYTGNRLSDIHLSKLCYLINWIPDRQKQFKNHYDFVFVIDDIVRKLFTYCQYAHAVAHRKNANLIACIDRNTLNPVDISENFPPLYQGKSIEANTLTNNDSNLIVFAFVASNVKEYSCDNRNKCMPIPLGYMAQKIEQLKLLGYQPVLVPYHLWKETQEQIVIEKFIINTINQQLHAMGIDDKEFPNA